VLILATVSYFTRHYTGNPSFAHINSGAGMLEIYARDDQKLWQVPHVNVEAAERALHARQSSIAIGDVTNDRKTDVVTSLQLEGTPDYALLPLQLFDASGKLLWKKLFDNERKDFRTVTYDNRYAPNDIKIADNYIYASIRNGHSPGYIVKIDPEGRTVGEYWHFGHLNFFMLPDDSGTHRWIVAIGRNDVDEYAGGSFGVIIILDTRKLFRNKRIKHLPWIWSRSIRCGSLLYPAAGVGSNERHACAGGGNGNYSRRSEWSNRVCAGERR
jgi:hypothetical protein